MRYLRQVCSGLAAVVLLAGCSAADDREALPSSTPTALDLKQAVSKHYHDELQRALIRRFEKYSFEVDGFTEPPQGWRPRADPLAGRSVSPPICRQVIQAGGRTATSLDGFPRDWPRHLIFGAMAVSPTTGKQDLAVMIVSLSGPYADAYMERILVPAPQCADISVGGGGKTDRASVVERRIEGFGPYARYVVRDYPVGGERKVERILMYRSEDFVVQIRSYREIGEPAFMRLAAAARDQAAQVLG